MGILATTTVRGAGSGATVSCGAGVTAPWPTADETETSNMLAQQQARISTRVIGNLSSRLFRRSRVCGADRFGNHLVREIRNRGRITPKDGTRGREAFY